MLASKWTHRNNAYEIEDHSNTKLQKMHEEAEATQTQNLLIVAWSLIITYYYIRGHVVGDIFRNNWNVKIS